MTKKSKTIIALVVILVLLITIPLFLVGGVELGYRKRSYMLRPFECLPNQLLPQLEVAYGIIFPKEFIEIKTAKSIPKEMFVHFVVKFSAPPNSVENFLATFPKRNRGFLEYNINRDRRDRVGSYDALAWYRTAIEKGKKMDLLLGGDAMVYIDTSNSKEYIVYFDGFYGIDYVPRKWKQ